jgi:hypothetical protein
MKTSLQILVATIAAGVVSAEQMVEIKKQVAETSQKFLTGEIPSADEITVMQYLSKQLVKTKSDGERAAETLAKKATAEAEYKRLVQEHGIAVNNLFTTFAKATSETVATAKKEKVVLVDGKSAIKALFDEFLKTLPAEPKKPGTGSSTKVSGSSATVWNKQVDIAKLKDGSTTKVLWDALTASEAGLTKSELIDVIAAKFPERGSANHKVSVYDATHGKLPLELVGEKYLAKLPEVELEIVNTEAELENAAK